MLTVWFLFFSAGLRWNCSFQRNLVQGCSMGQEPIVFRSGSESQETYMCYWTFVKSLGISLWGPFIVYLIILDTLEKMSYVAHPVCGCRLFQVTQREMGEEGDPRGWSPLLHWDPAHQRRSHGRLRQGLTYGQGWLSRTYTLTFIDRKLWRFVFL